MCNRVDVSVHRRYHVSKRRIIPLPTYKADPHTTAQALFKPKQVSVVHTISLAGRGLEMYVVHFSIYSVVLHTRLSISSAACPCPLPSDHLLLQSSDSPTAKGCESSSDRLAKVLIVGQLGFCTTCITHSMTLLW